MHLRSVQWSNNGGAQLTEQECYRKPKWLPASFLQGFTSLINRTFVFVFFMHNSSREQETIHGFASISTEAVHSLY